MGDEKICFLFIVIIVIVLIVILCKKAGEKRNAEKAVIKERMMHDTFILENALVIVESVKDLKNAPVKVLRTGGTFYLIFNEGSVFYETRWMEGSGENRQLRKNTQCILNRLDEGKNPLSRIEDEVFAEIVKESLDRVAWMAVSFYGREISVTKASGKIIPEVES